MASQSKERDAEAVQLAVDFSENPVTVGLPRDQRTKVIVYGPAYRADSRYDLVIRWPGHQVLAFQDLGDDSVEFSDFDPIDPEPTGNGANVFASLFQNGALYTNVRAFLSRTNAGFVLTFYDFKIGRFVVEVLFFSVSD